MGGEDFEMTVFRSEAVFVRVVFSPWYLGWMFTSRSFCWLVNKHLNWLKQNKPQEDALQLPKPSVRLSVFFFASPIHLSAQTTLLSSRQMPFFCRTRLVANDHVIDAPIVFCGAVPSICASLNFIIS